MKAFQISDFGFRISDSAVRARAVGDGLQSEICNLKSAILFALALLCASAASADWLTHRANPERTGSLDGLPGPKLGKVLWAFKAQQHFIASPVVSGRMLLVSALGPFNTGVFQALVMDPKPPERIVWAKSAPFLKLPLVCSPVVSDGIVVFGDGMHQTDGATLYALKVDTGRPLWQLPLPGALVHLECPPTIDKGRVYIGGGEAGLLCVDLKRALLDGQELDIPGIQKLMDQRWKELVARYEEERKKDPEFAIPPTEDSLPKPNPKVIWHQGAGKWHVDAPVAVVGDRLLAGSAYIEEDKVGKRAILCLNANDGSLLWEQPLKHNPWAGPTITGGNLVIVGCSSIRYDTKLIPKAQGEIVALDLASGQVKWRRDTPGGILSSIAVKDGLALFTCTDGRLRAWDIQTGQQKWEFLAQNPFFAGPAVTGDSVYAADLKAMLYAVNLADGKVRWTLDVANDPTVRSQGMVFGSPVVSAGEIYLATCNFEGGAAAQAPCAVVCVSDRAAAEVQTPTFNLDKPRRRVEIPCRIAPRKLPNLQEIYPLEVVATYPAPLGQKAHETVVTFDVRPSDVAKALESLGVKPGAPARGDEEPPTGPELRVLLAVPGVVEGKPRLLPIERTMIDRRTGMCLPPLKWHFTGSAMRQPDPEKPLKVYGADLGGTLITLFPVTDETVIQSNLSMTHSSLLRMEVNKNVLPDEGTPVTLVIEAK